MATFGTLTTREADKALKALRKQMRVVSSSSTRMETYREVETLELLAGDVKRFLAEGGAWHNPDNSEVVADTDD